VDPQDTMAKALAQQLRNQEICRLYEEERLTLASIGARYNISRERVRQIVNTYNVEKRIPLRTDAVRNKFIGAYITEDDKKTLKEEALQRGLSISLMTSDFVHIMLQELRDQQPPPIEPIQEQL
jgi:hypothetical protein